MATTKGGLPVLAFASAALFEHWLSIHHHFFCGVWIKIIEKTPNIASITYNEALDEALCYGWIDGQRDSYEVYTLQRFGPRRPKSLWSTRNINAIAALASRGKMQPSGIAEVDAAKHDGRWMIAYASSKSIVFPDDFLEALEKNKKAQQFFNTLSKPHVYTIARRLDTASTPDIRRRHFKTLLAMLERGEFR